MKTIKQKAEAYDEALEIAKEYHKQLLNEDNPEWASEIEKIFPELKESEDERIRKGIIRNLEYLANKSEGFYKDELKERIAWLEKQGEKQRGKSALEAVNEEKVNNANKVEPKFQVGDTMRTLQEAADGYTDGMPVVVFIDKEYYHCTNELIAIKDQDDYEFPPINVKQKPIYKVEPTPAWSEVDKDFMYDTLSNLTELKDRYGEGYGNVGKCIDWLKSLKERVQPQQKKEWSEDDEEEFQIAIDTLVEAGQHASADWLQSLKDIYTWKPSEEQMDALQYVCRNLNPPLSDKLGWNSLKTLELMFEQLKKLKE